MRPPCEIITQSMLPLIRGLVARELISVMTQKEVATKMGVSQPTISSYLKSLSKISSDEKEYLESDTIKQLVQSITKNIINNNSPEEIIRTICSACVSLRINSLTCRKHIASYNELKHGCKGCLPIIDNTLIEGRKQILNDLNESLELIEREESFVKIMPEVLTNICQCSPNTNSIDDIAAIPGRITKVRGRARTLFTAEFGVSTHLAKILLKVNSLNDLYKSVICIVFNDKIRSILNDQNIPSFELESIFFNEFFFQEKSDLIEDPLVKQLITLIKNNSVVDKIAIIDKGGVGVEPISYLFGVSSQDVVELSVLISKYY